MSRERRLGVLGGTFDPIHNGHVRAAEEAERFFRLDEIRVIPSSDPPHRPVDPRASAFHRFALVALAIDGKANWTISDAELTRTGPSYTADTLRALHAEGWRPTQIYFILGADAFAEIATWYEFPAVLDAANFVVVARPGAKLDAAWERPGKTTGIHLLDAETPDISSTEIRARLAAGSSIGGLVPPAVERYIANHRLYGETQRILR